MEQVNWFLPGMEKFSEQQLSAIKRSLDNEDIVNSIHCLGWALWPTENRGYYDSEWLRVIADFLEIQNKPFWDEYEAYCQAQQEEAEAAARGECTNLEGCKNECNGACGYTTFTHGDELCLDELGFTATPTSTTETSAVSSPPPE